MNAETTGVASYHLTRISFAWILASLLVKLFSKAGGKLIKKFWISCRSKASVYLGAY